MESRGRGEQSAVPMATDLVAPSIGTPQSYPGTALKPQIIVRFFSSAEWEVFIREWVTGIEEDYDQVKKLGGPNDEGIDVAAFKTPHHFEGPWDCFQGKHYDRPLNFSDAFPEMLKLFAHVHAGDYVCPDSYQFLAPHGCGTGFSRLLSKPTKLRDEFLARLAKGGKTTDMYSPEDIEAARVLAEGTDFSIFRSVEVVDVIATHSKTPYHAARFARPLPARDMTAPPPEGVTNREAKYVSALVDAYSEKHPDDDFEVASLHLHDDVGEHFSRQRVAFFQADALRVYARDSVHADSFDRLQDDVYSGVVEVSESDHPDGLTRLREVLIAATQIDLSAHTLYPVIFMEDRKGICHHLANESRLGWRKLSKK